ncbi:MULTISPECIES: hypothetical protein [Amycolatopsis]|uniref:hypothetical protein n=1 Tax=Amycolatopsis TaxID=1813 RepID=UPI0033ADE5FE
MRQVEGEFSHVAELRQLRGVGVSSRWSATPGCAASASAAAARTGAGKGALTRTRTAACPAMRGSMVAGSVSGRIFTGTSRTRET